MTNDVNQINTKICLKIKMERVKRGWSQEQLSEYADISKTSISVIERAQSTPSTVTLAKFAKAFGITVSELTDIEKVEL